MSKINVELGYFSAGGISAAVYVCVEGEGTTVECFRDLNRLFGPLISLKPDISARAFRHF